MNNAAKSVFVFGLYLAALSLMVMVTPNTLLGLLACPRRPRFGFASRQPVTRLVPPSTPPLAGLQCRGRRLDFRH